MATYNPAYKREPEDDCDSEKRGYYGLFYFHKSDIETNLSLIRNNF